MGHQKGDSSKSLSIKNNLLCYSINPLNFKEYRLANQMFCHFLISAFFQCGFYNANEVIILAFHHSLMAVGSDPTSSYPFLARNGKALRQWSTHNAPETGSSPRACPPVCWLCVEQEHPHPTLPLAVLSSSFWFYHA